MRETEAKWLFVARFRYCEAIMFPDAIPGATTLFPAPKPVEAIDRITPTRRPEGRIVMRQQWRDLLFLHWEVSSAQLQSLIPSELTIDTFEGKAYIGLVPFTMRNVRPVWSPSVPPLSNFHETNVRAYVHYKGRNPGVWFFSLDAANAIAVQIARAWFKLPYFYARMQLEKEKRIRGEEEIEVNQSAIHNPQSTIKYMTERLWPSPVPARCEVNWTTEEGIRHAEPGTLEHFLIERYILYAYRNGNLYSGQVHHPTYPVQNATVELFRRELDCAGGDYAARYAATFDSLLDGRRCRYFSAAARTCLKILFDDLADLV